MAPETYVLIGAGAQALPIAFGGKSFTALSKISLNKKPFLLIIQDLLQILVFVQVVW